MLYELLNLRKELKHLESITGGIIKPTDPLYSEVEGDDEAEE